MSQLNTQYLSGQFHIRGTEFSLFCFCSQLIFCLLKWLQGNGNGNGNVMQISTVICWYLKCCSCYCCLFIQLRNQFVGNMYKIPIKNNRFVCVMIISTDRFDTLILLFPYPRLLYGTFLFIQLMIFIAIYFSPSNAVFFGYFNSLEQKLIFTFSKSFELTVRHHDYSAEQLANKIEFRLDGDNH